MVETHASKASISPGGSLGSGTVQKPLDLSMSILRQCCAEARLPASRNVRDISTFVGVVVTIAKCYAGASEFVRTHASRSGAISDYRNALCRRPLVKTDAADASVINNHCS